MAVGENGAGAVLTGGIEAFAVEGLAGVGVDGGEDAAAAYHIHAAGVIEWGGDFRDPAIVFPGEMTLGDVATAAGFHGNEQGLA